MKLEDAFMMLCPFKFSDLALTLLISVDEDEPEYPAQLWCNGPGCMAWQKISPPNPPLPKQPLAGQKPPVFEFKR